jgi:O-antigen/teichoic acid export membrane protein
LFAIGRKKGALRLQLRYRDVRSYLAFGSYQIGERILNYATARVDVLIIGRFLGTDVLGAYTLAYQVVLMPLTRINPILTRVAFPLFARRQAAEEFLRKGFLALSKLLSIVVFPFLFGLALTSSLALPMLFGEKWSLSAALIPALSVVGALKALSNPAGIVLLSKGRVAIGFWWNALLLIANSTVFFIAVHWGLDAMIRSYVCLSIIYWVAFLLILQKVLPFAWASYWSSLKPATVGCLVMAIVVQAVYAFWPKLAAPLAEVAALIAAGATAYVICLYVLDAEYFRTLSRLARVPKTEN